MAIAAALALHSTISTALAQDVQDNLELRKPLDEKWQGVWERVRQALVGGGESKGSGFFIGDKMVATAYHCVDGDVNDEPALTRDQTLEYLRGGVGFWWYLPDGWDVRLRATGVVHADAAMDIAVLSVQFDGDIGYETWSDLPQHPKALAWSRELPRVGDEVMAFGLPTYRYLRPPEARDESIVARLADDYFSPDTSTRGYDKGVIELGQHATIGKVVAVHDLGGGRYIVQATSAIRPGFSGGPLVNSRGEVIGINAFVRFAGETRDELKDLEQPQWHFQSYFVRLDDLDKRLAAEPQPLEVALFERQSDTEAQRWFEKAAHTPQERIANLQQVIKTARAHQDDWGCVTSAHHELIRLFASSERYDLMRQAVVDALRHDPADAYFRLELAREWEHSGQPARALAEYQRAIELLPGYERSYQGKAAIHLAAGDKAAAIQTYRQLYDFMADHWEYEWAIRAADSILQLDPGNIDIMYGRVFAQYRLRQFASAVTGLETVLAQNPKHFAARRDLGHCLRELDQLEAAITAYEDALALQPDSIDVLTNLGICRTKIGQHDRAVSVLRRAVELDDKAAPLRYWLAKTYEAQGKYADAAECFELYATLDPDRLLDVDAFHRASILYSRAGLTDKAGYAFARHLEAKKRDSGD